LLQQCGSPKAARKFFNDLKIEAEATARHGQNVRVQAHETKGKVPSAGTRTFTQKPSRQDRQNPYSEIADAAFPLPLDIAPAVLGSLWYRNGTAYAKNMLLNSWANPYNAQCHRAYRYEKLMPRLDTGAEYFCWDVASEDWSPKQHASLVKKLKRASGYYIRFNHTHSRRAYLYFTNLELPDWTPVVDLSDFLIHSLNHCRPPALDDTWHSTATYKPICGNAAWINQPAAENEDNARVLVATMPKGINFREFLAVLSVKFNLEAEFEAARTRLQYGPTVFFPVQDFRATEEIALAAGMALKPVGKQKSTKKRCMPSFT
jgi:hypothetical protein